MILIIIIMTSMDSHKSSYCDMGALTWKGQAGSLGAVTIPTSTVHNILACSILNSRCAFKTRSSDVRQTQASSTELEFQPGLHI